MRNKIIEQPTRRQSQVAISVATNIINNDETNEEPIESTNTTKQNKDKLIIHYTHEKRFASSKRDLHQNYKDVFGDTPAMNIKMIVGNRNRRVATNDLIRKKPKRSLLKNQPYKTKSCPPRTTI